MGKTEKLTELVEQASGKNPLLAGGLIKQAASLSADILTEHERRLETCAGALGQMAGSVRALTESYRVNRGLLDAVVRDVATLAGLVAEMREAVAELAARSGMTFKPGSGVIVEGEYQIG